MLSSNTDHVSNYRIKSVSVLRSDLCGRSCQKLMDALAEPPGRGFLLRPDRPIETNKGVDQVSSTCWGSRHHVAAAMTNISGLGHRGVGAPRASAVLTIRSELELEEEPSMGLSVGRP